MRRHQFEPAEAPVSRLPRPQKPSISPQHFLACPAALLQGLSAEQVEGQQHVYRLALEQAQAVARPSLAERDLLGVWN
jgi:hypothetical protein